MFTVCTEKEDPIKEEPNTEEPAEGNPNEGNPLTDGHVGPRGSIYDDHATGVYVAPNGNDATATGALDKHLISVSIKLLAPPNPVVL